MLFDTKDKLELRVASSFFATSGWVPDAPFYTGIFQPATDWVAKRRGELRVMFSGDQRKTKVRIVDLLNHSLSVTLPTQSYLGDTSAELSPSSTSSDRQFEQLMRDVQARRRTATAAQAAIDDASSPSATSVSAESSDWSPRRRRSPHVTISGGREMTPPAFWFTCWVVWGGAGGGCS